MVGERRIQTKICGIGTNVDAELAVDAGAQYLGFIFVRESPRYIEPDIAKSIVRNIKQSDDHLDAVQIVGVFQNQSSLVIEEILERVSCDFVQLHGNETPEFCENLSKPVIKTFQIADKESSHELCKTLYARGSNAFAWLNTIHEYRHKCSYILFDKPKDCIETQWLGHAIKNLVEIENELGQYFFGGGVNSSNVSEVLQTLCPSVLDICSGVEDAYMQKSKRKLQELFLVTK